MVLSLDLAVLTLAPDFTKLELEEPKIVVNLEQIGFLSAGVEDEFQSPVDACYILYLHNIKKQHSLHSDLT